MGNNTRRPTHHAKRLQLAGLGALAIVTGGLVVGAVTQTPQTSEASPARTFTPGATAAPTAEATPTIDSADLPAAMARLDDKATPWTLTVLGDSTGNDGNEWVAALGRTIAQEKSRPVTYYAWDATSATYASPVTYGRGTEAAVTIWNGSAAGMGPDYSLTNLPAQAPQPSDVLLINHGHNYATPEQGAADEAALIVAVADRWKSIPAVAVTVQNPRITNAEIQDANLAALTEIVAGSSYTVIDVASAYRAQPDLAGLLYADGTHPNEAGQEIWSQTVDASLGL